MSITTKKLLTGGGRFVLAALTVSAILAGCNADATDGVYKPSLPNPPIIVESEKDNPSIKAKFGVTTAGIEGIRETFNTLHNYLAYTPNLQETGTGKNLKLGDIALGDWIDLEGLKIDEYTRDGLNDGFGTNANNGYLNTRNVELRSNEYLLRLIVVGINTFSETKVGDSFINPDAPPHLVFHFQNTPAKHRMNDINTTVGGYKGSEMREYLVPVEGKAGSGAFLAGLINAGVPEDVLWAPTRKVRQGWIDAQTPSTALDDINDALWIPTEWEMFGDSAYSNLEYETAENQNQLMYYYSSVSTQDPWYFTSPTTRGKYNSDGYISDYWVSSVSNSTSYLNVQSSYNGFWVPDGNNWWIVCGHPANWDYNLYAAPAFCVK